MMKRHLSAPLLAVGLLLTGGCASGAASDRAPAATRVVPQGPTTRAVPMPTTAGPGQAKEVGVLVDEPGLKLALITLRNGTVLPDHATPVAATIVVLEGSGTVTAEGKRLRLERGHMVVLAANVVHAVEPDPGSDLLLLVHHLQRDKEAPQ